MRRMRQLNKGKEEMKLGGKHAEGANDLEAPEVIIATRAREAEAPRTPGPAL